MLGGLPADFSEEMNRGGDLQKSLPCVLLQEREEAKGPEEDRKGFCQSEAH